MSSISKILVPFDFTEPAIAALEYTLRFVGFERPIQVQAIYASTSNISESDIKETQASFDKVVGSLNKRTKFKPELLTVKGELVKSVLEARNEC